MLATLQSYLSQQKAANLIQLSTRLNSTPDMVRDMLQLMIRKGRVRLCPQVAGCGSSCSKCNPLLTEVYEWIGS